MGVVFKLDRDKTRDEIKAEIHDQLVIIDNPKLVDAIKKHLVDPELHFAIWDYSKDQAKYPVWLIGKSKEHDTGILYSEYGFDFGNWGLTTLSDEPFHFGPDFCWYPSLENVFLESFMSEGFS